MRHAGLILGVTALLGCGDGTVVGLTPADVAGAYVATTLTLDEGAGPIDQLALGGSIQITLLADGSTTGLLLIPGGAVDGSDFEADLAGTWVLTGQAVRLVHDSDSFLRDVVLAYVDGTLSGSRTDGVVTIQVELARQ